MNDQPNSCPTYIMGGQDITREIRKMPPYPIADDKSFSEAVYPKQPGEVLPINDLVQNIRLIRSLAEVREGLEKLQKKSPEAYATVSRFFTSCSHCASPDQEPVLGHGIPSKG